MSDTSEERSPRFSRAILGRIVAVLAFVGLGTFAVIQSVVGDRNKPPETSAVAAAEPPAQQLQQDQQSDSPLDNKLSVKSSFQPPAIPATNQISFGKSENEPKSRPDNQIRRFPQSQSTSFDDNSFPKPKTAPNTQLPTTSPPPANSSAAFEFNRRQTNSQTTKSEENQDGFAKSAATLPPIVVSKQATGTVQPLRSTFQPTQFPARQTPETARDTSMGNTSLNPGGFVGADNALQNTGDIARDAANSAVQKSSQSLQNLRSNVNPAINPANSSLASVTQPNSASVGDRPTAQSNSFLNRPAAAAQPPSSKPLVSLDTSQGLRPFGQTSESANDPTHNTRPNTDITNNAPVRNAQPDQRFSAQSTQSFNTQSPQRFGSAPNSSPPGQPLHNVSSSSRVVESAPMPETNDAATKEVPGDRQLEGVRAPSLTVEKIAPREIQVNQPADFQIIIRNAGRVTANNVQVFDQIPDGTEFITAVPQPNRSGANDLRWDLGEMRPGQEKRVSLQLKPTRPGEIGSVAQVTFATQASMRTLVTKPVLQIQHSAQPKVLIGDNAIFDITVENKGDGPANNVIVQQDVPEQLEFSDGSAGIEYPIGTLGPGQSKKLKLALRAAQIGRLKNVVVATADGGLRAQHALDMEVIAPQLVATAQGPSRKFLNREATFQFSVENKGTADATNVELVARLPGGLKFAGANNRGRYDPNSNAVYWSLAELTPTVVGSVEVKTVPTESGDQKIEFEAVADLKQKAQASISLAVEDLIDMFFDIDDTVDPIEVGALTQYKIRVVNQGTKTATNVQIDVDFSNGIQPASVDGTLPNQISAQKVSFAPITSMNPGDELKLTVNAKGVSPGDHRVVVHLQTDGRETNVSKEETTRVYSDR